ncbi:rnhA, partial [Mucuna pruriens]
MLTKRGIEANPDKCRAMIDMRSSQNMKEDQQLMGRVTALSRFISKAFETATPILNTLKERNFAWTFESEEPFLQLKAMLATPPILVRPELGQPLIIVRTDLSVRQVLRKLDLAGRMGSNNQAKYEALFVGKRLALEIEARRLTVKSDSKLMTGQVNGEYQTKDPKLAKYWEKAIVMEASFECFTLLHVPRDQNERADLRKLEHPNDR